MSVCLLYVVGVRGGGGLVQGFLGVNETWRRFSIGGLGVVGL